MQVKRSALAATAVAALLVTGCSSDQSPDAVNGTGASSSPSGRVSSGPSDEASPKASAGSPDGSPDGSAAAAATTPGPDLPEHPRKQTRVLDALDGSSDQKCVGVGDSGDVRSGSIAMGNFARARGEFADQVGSMEQPEVHFYVIPEHLHGADGVRVTLTPTRGGETRTIRVRRLESAEVWKYYAVAANIPGPGSYRMTAVSGEDHGCFLVDFDR